MILQNSGKWLLLVHQIPPKPNTFRVKIWRRLQKIGAVAIKQSVYAMPLSDHSLEDLSWTLKEIIAGGGDGSIFEASFVEGLNDEQIISLFQNARKADYEKIIREANSLLAAWSSAEGDQVLPVKRSVQLTRLKARLDETIAIDFFHASERGTADILFKELEKTINSSTPVKIEGKGETESLNGRTWVARKNIFVDRISSGWLIKRFIDENAEFKFVSSSRYAPKNGELRFDMFDGEFTHEGDKCTFEVMIEKLKLQNKALNLMAEVIHDIDLKDAKFSRPETDGVKALLTGLVAVQPDDHLRMKEGFFLFENLYAYFYRNKH
ncbi:MAG: chromate resistance protein ChrB domain-containing protein [Desulfobacula sp.]